MWKLIFCHISNDIDDLRISDYAQLTQPCFKTIHKLCRYLTKYYSCIGALQVRIKVSTIWMTIIPPYKFSSWVYPIQILGKHKEELEKCIENGKKNQLENFFIKWLKLLNIKCKSIEFSVIYLLKKASLLSIK